MVAERMDSLEVDDGDSKVGMIHPSIIEILKAIGPIAKSQKNNTQGYNYRGIDQIYNAVHPHFSEQGVYSTSKILDAKHLEGKSDKGKPYVHSILRMRFTFWASDGSHVSTEVIGEGIDYGGDKASNKAMSTADKYAILQLLKIPTAVVDNDTAGEDEKKPAEEPKPRKSAMEIMQEQAAAEAAASSTNGSSSPTAGNSPELATEYQIARIKELAVLLQCGEKVEAACQKRGCNSVRSLRKEDAAEMLEKLERNFAAKKAEQAAEQPPAEMPPCGPATEKQIEAIKGYLKEFAQFAADDYAKFMERLKAWLNGRKLADIDANQAAQLADAVRHRSLPAFIAASLENYQGSSGK